MNDRLATIDMGQKVGAVPPFFGRGEAGSPSNTMWPEPRPTFVPSGTFSHPAVWPQESWLICKLSSYPAVTWLNQDRGNDVSFTHNS